MSIRNMALDSKQAVVPHVDDFASPEILAGIEGPEYWFRLGLRNVVVVVRVVVQDNDVVATFGLDCLWEWS